MTEPENVIVELNGHDLQNDRTLSSHGVVSQTTLRMRARVPGGAEDFEVEEPQEEEEEEEGPPEDRGIGKGGGIENFVAF
jgi:hypothetical protein